MTISRNFSVMAQGASTAGVLSPPYGGALQWQAVQTTSFAAVAGQAYLVNTTSGTVTVTLPASPTIGQMVQITDYAGTFAANNCTVARNGSNINGLAVNSLLNVSRESLALVYTDATQGWVGYSAFIATSLGQSYTATYLIVAGGASGGLTTTNGSSGGGGGGAGGFLTGTTALALGTTYTFVVGAGGPAPSGSPYYGGNGSDSTGFSLTAIGGGGGGGSSGGSIAARSGGSGGGSSNDGGSGPAGGSGTSGQGNAGGSFSGTYAGPNYPSAGGGGAGAAGGNVTSTTAGGAGGAGTASSITGSSITYAGGGGGSTYNGGTPGAGGAGGGGAGNNGTGNATAGTVNSGGGGGGADKTGATTYLPGAGGSGVVILSVPTANYTGTTTGSPTVTTSGSNTILKFTASGSYTA